MNGLVILEDGTAQFIGQPTNFAAFVDILRQVVDQLEKERINQLKAQFDSLSEEERKRITA